MDAVSQLPCSAPTYLWRRNIFGQAAPYTIEITSIASWSVGAIGLLMHGGNPRVAIVEKELSPHVEKRLQQLVGGSGDDIKVEESIGVEKNENTKSEDSKIEESIKVEGKVNVEGKVR